MKRIISLWILALGTVAMAQTTAIPPLAPTSCPTTPCLKADFTVADASTTNPVTVTGAYCIGGAAQCGTSPSAPGIGPNTWTSYNTSPLTTTAGAIILPGFQYGQLVNIALQSTEGGGTSAWVSQVFQIPAQTVNPPTGVTLTVLKAGQS